jgi:hypothetical protein
MSSMLTRVAFAVLLLLPSVALAQGADHRVVTRIPNYIGLKIVDEAGDIALGAAVVFDYESDPEAYVAAIEGSGRLSPTNAVDFADVQVAVRGGGWRVFVGAFPLSYAGDHAGAGLQLADIRVERGAVSGLTPTAITHLPGGSMSAAWNLSNSWRRIARDTGSTGGWRSLGFNGLDYVLAVQGDEDPGRYTTVVLYLLTNP